MNDIKRRKTELQQLRERNSQLLKECDELQCKLNIMEKQQMVNKAISALPDYAQSAYLRGQLMKMDSEKEMKESVGNLLTILKGRVTESGEEFDGYEDSQQVSKKEKSQVIEAVKADRALKIVK